MPNNPTPITTLQRLEEKKQIAKEKTACDIGFYFGTLGDNLNEFTQVTGKVKGLKIYLNHTTGGFMIDQQKLLAIFQAWPSENGPILLHAEDEKIKDVLEAVKATGKHAHICHVASTYELCLIMEAKEKGIPLTCGVTPHHLFLTEDDTQLLKQFGMMKPVLKTKKDQEFLWNHLAVIDVIESDHAPHTMHEKQSDQDHFGVPGLETTLPLLLTAVSQNRLTIDDVIRLCYLGSSNIFGITNNEQTKIEVDQNYEYEIKNENLFTKCKWSPFNGWKVKGKVVNVFLRGEEVLKNGIIVSTPGSGRLI
jgi:carbamoyl-phosphate synthase/aspartate carbamoyltransferase/dihydroorotase